MHNPGGLTVIVPYRNGQATLSRLLQSLPDGLPVLVIDDVSDRPLLINKPNVTVIRLPERGYFAGAVNAGIAACTTDVLILNQDVRLEGNDWQRLIDHNRPTGILGNAVRGHPAWPKGYVDGVFMYLSRAAINKVGDFNGQDFPLWGCTADWQARACRKGFTALPVQVGGLVHERTGAYGMSIQAALRDEPGEAGRFIRTPPLVSVVIPCHNHGRYLADTVHSLIGGTTCLGDHPGQTFTAFEVIIVDDASTDDSWQTAQALADPWQGIHALRMPQNGGTGAAMNFGIEHSFGRYIQGLDADDMLEPTALDTLYGIVSEDEHAVPYHDQRLFADGQRGETWTMREYDFETLLGRNLLPAGIMFSRKAWQMAGGYREEMKWGRQDWAFAVALGQAGYCGVRVAEPLYLYRREGQNRTLRNSDPQWRQTFSEQMRGLFPALYRGERPMACCGGSRRRPQAQPAPPRGAARGQMAAMQGQAKTGMVMIEYIGGSVGETSWFGAASGMHYRFGLKHKVGYVYESDLAGFLDARKGRQPQFRRYVAPKPPPVKPEPAPDPVVPPVVFDDTPELRQVVAEAVGRQNLDTGEQVQSYRETMTQLTEKPQRRRRKKSDV